MADEKDRLEAFNRGESPDSPEPLLNGVPVDLDAQRQQTDQGSEAQNPYAQQPYGTQGSGWQPTVGDAQTYGAGAQASGAAQQPYSNQQSYGQQPYSGDPYGQQPYSGDPYGQPYAGGGQAPYGAGQPYPPYPYDQQPSSNGKAIASLICGIFAIILSPSIIFGIVLGVVAIVLGVMATKVRKDGKATGGKVCGVIGIVFSVILLVIGLVIGFATLSYVTDEMGSSGSVAIEAVDTDAEEQEVENLIAPRLDELCAMDEEQIASLGTALDAEFAETGLSLTEIGVNPTDVARWVTTDMSYVIDYVTVYSSTDEGYVSATVTTRDLGTLSSMYVDNGNAFLESAEASGMSEADQLARLGQIFYDAMNQTTATYDSLMLVDVDCIDGIWTIDEESWQEEVDYVFWIM